MEDYYGYAPCSLPGEWREWRVHGDTVELFSLFSALLKISSNHHRADNAGEFHQDLPNKQGSRHSLEGRQLLHLGHCRGDISTRWEK